MNEMQIFNNINSTQNQGEHMSENNIFKNDPFDKLDLKKQFQFFGELAYMIAEALNSENEETAEEILRNASNYGYPLGCSQFNTLYSSARELIAIRFTKSEFTYHRLFEKYACRLIQDCQVVDVKSNGKDIPDSWVKIRGEICPVEIKLKEFNEKAKNQLLRYMTSYNSKYGIAVGEHLSTELPDNIAFISTAELEAFE